MLKSKFLIIAFISVILFYFMSYINFLKDTNLSAIFLKDKGGPILIITPSKKKILIDTSFKMPNIDKYLPLFDRNLDILVVTHCDKDHSGATEDIVKYFSVSHIFTNKACKEELKKRIKNSNVNIKELYLGDIIDFGDGVKLNVLYPFKGLDFSKNNKNALVVLLEFGKTKFLIMSDADAEKELLLTHLFKEQLKSNVLQVSHHGSANGTEKLFLGFVNPEFSILTNSPSRFHPSKNTLEKLSQTKTKTILIKDKDYILISDSEKVFIR